jgi:hypothetical protein
MGPCSLHSSSTRLGGVVIDLELENATVDRELGEEEATQSHTRKGRERRRGSRSRIVVGVE